MESGSTEKVNFNYETYSKVNNIHSELIGALHMIDVKDLNNAEEFIRISLIKLESLMDDLNKNTNPETKSDLFDALS